MATAMVAAAAATTTAAEMAIVMAATTTVAAATMGCYVLEYFGTYFGYLPRNFFSTQR